LQSVGEARLLLRDWLVIFSTNYHRNSYMRASAGQLLKLPVSIPDMEMGLAGISCAAGTTTPSCNVCLYMNLTMWIEHSDTPILCSQQVIVGT
jgi:hypothetical protein